MSRIAPIAGLAALLATASIGHDAQAQIPPDTKSFAVVNGVNLPQAYLDLAMAAAKAAGKEITPASRKAAALDLVARAVLSQEARRQDIDKREDIRTQVALFEQNLLADAAVAKFMEHLVIDEAEVKADYERQKTLLKGAREYHLGLIVLPTEAAAKAVIVGLKKGDPFEKIARDKSIDPSAKSGGDLGWVLVEQILPAVGNVVANLSKGNISAVPIRTPAGWNVVKVEDIRPFTMPPLDKVAPRIRSALRMKARTEYINKLVSGAKVHLVE